VAGGVGGERSVDACEVDALLGGQRQRPGRGDRGDRGGVLGGHRPGSVGGGQAGQLFQGACGPDQPGRAARGEAAVPAQPGGHGPQPVLLWRLRHLRTAHGAGELGVDPGTRGDQRRGAVEQQRPGQCVGVLGGQAVEGGDQPLQRLITARTHVRTIPPCGRSGRLNPQVRRLSTDVVNPLDLAHVPWTA
jgi:hypothetical protein